MGPASKIESVKIQGFRSLADVELTDLPNAAVLIGPNGSGKSNVVRFLDMVHFILRYRDLATYVVQQGGADDQLYGGADTTESLYADILCRTSAGLTGYDFTLAYSMLDKLYFHSESIRQLQVEPSLEPWSYDLGRGHRETNLVEFARSASLPPEQAEEIRNLLGLFRNRAVFQFCDTTYNSNIKARQDVEDSDRLFFHGGNLAAVLYRLEQEDTRRYDYICELISRILPTFHRFDLEESFGKVMLRWKSLGSDKTMGAHLTSDGSLRAFCLVTLLNLPEEMLPSVILLDEPELGLHPSAVGLVGAMIKVMSKHRQVIVATQSPLLVDEFTPDEIFVTELKEGQTVITRQDEEYLSVWLEEYSTGELWQKNVMGGHP